MSLYKRSEFRIDESAVQVYHCNYYYYYCFETYVVKLIEQWFS